jgi:hypothetical protein
VPNGQYAERERDEIKASYLQAGNLAAKKRKKRKTDEMARVLLCVFCAFLRLAHFALISLSNHASHIVSTKRELL